MSNVSVNQSFLFSLSTKKGKARAGVFHTPSGVVHTPAFMPVGTVASIKGLDTKDIIELLNPDIILANAYHLYLQPGMDTLYQLGGVKSLMGWQRPLLTDSGGFQVWSLSQQSNRHHHTKITDHGVGFRSHRDGTEHFFTPEKAIEVQRYIGADVMMAFDDCTPDGAQTPRTSEAVERTWNWTQRAVAYWQSVGGESLYGQPQAFFGIAQGSSDRDWRRRAVEQLLTLPVTGLALGGESIGYNRELTTQIMTWVDDLLPEELPRYGMGIGREPADVVAATLAGYDLFDCVGPTRLARNGVLFDGWLDFSGPRPRWNSHWPNGRLQIGQNRFKADDTLVTDQTKLYLGDQRVSRAYLHHLYRAGELAYYRLASIHNLQVMLTAMHQLRRWLHA